MIIQPLKPNWKVDEDSAVDAQKQIKDRVNSEDNYTWCKGFPCVKSEDITGRAGEPIFKGTDVSF